MNPTLRIHLIGDFLLLDVQRQEFVGMALSNLGWVALRLGNVDECREKCLAALEVWQPLSIKYPFC